MAPHSSTLAWKIPRTVEPGRLQSIWSWRVAHDWATSLSFSLSCIGEGNGNPLQCSCLENARDSRAWWAAVYGIAESRTRLKQLSSSSSSSIYSFPMINYSCSLSAGVLHALLCLKMYSWCIRVERCTPCPPTPLPSCSLLIPILILFPSFLLTIIFFLDLWLYFCFVNKFICTIFKRSHM